MLAAPGWVEGISLMVDQQQRLQPRLLGLGFPHALDERGAVWTIGSELADQRTINLRDPGVQPVAQNVADASVGFFQEVPAGDRLVPDRPDAEVRQGKRG